ncbi:hypothetical protein C1645_829260 [Glomus cerebriforme]|uniref:F-box domain-containing protein n=1 Tax=Glomus cerebriforme TaxID=658196 RepID=A0A397SQY7_9GLOM|nr:hypothetical protein C1645_829260 [Glomus cerebriforme]
MRNYHILQEFKAHWITDYYKNCIINSCPNLRNLDIAFSHEEIEDAKVSPKLRHLKIGHNDIGNKVTKVLAHTCHKLEYLDYLNGCKNISKKIIGQLNQNIHIENFEEDYYSSDSESSGSETESESESSTVDALYNKF